MKQDPKTIKIFLATSAVALTVGTAFAQYDPIPLPPPAQDPIASPTPLQCPFPSPTPNPIGTPTPAADATVGMDNLIFTPNPIQIRVGQTVTWTNNSSLQHTVTADPCDPEGQERSSSIPPGATPFDSGTLAPGQSFTYTFTTPGEYTYFCRFHEGMNGRIIVTQ